MYKNRQHKIIVYKFLRIEEKYITLQSNYDDLIEDIECPECHTVGMLPDGGFDWICLNCGYEGGLEDED